MCESHALKPPRNTESHPIPRRMASHSESFIPALRFRWLTALYDPLLAVTTRERTFKDALLTCADLRPDSRLLDLACGTGTLIVWAKRREPGIEVVGVDADADVLVRARAKATAAGIPADFREALSFALPFPDAAFDAVTASLFFHHLLPDQKRRTLKEVRRVLRPGGRFCVADWGQPSGLLMRLLFYPVQLLDGFANTADHVSGRLPDYFREAGFHDVRELRRFSTIFGTLAIYSAIAPS